MKRVLITGAGSYIGTSVEDWLNRTPGEFTVDTVSTMNEEWKTADFSAYDVVFHVAGFVHVDAKPSMEPLYRRINTDLAIDVAKWAKEHHVKQFIFMSSTIVYRESKSLKPTRITKDTVPTPNGFYGDSKLQAEIGLHGLEDECFKVVILRPPMIYGPGCKGNFKRLANLSVVTPVFPAYHNKRSMLYIDNLCEFVKQAIIRELNGTWFPQNREYADTVEIVSTLAKRNGHRLHVWKWLNFFVRIGSPFVNAVNKMFADYTIDESMSEYDFDYRTVSLSESLERISVPMN